MRSLLEDLTKTRNPYRVKAFEELAKHCERTEKDPAKALEWTAAALALAPSEELEKRRARLEKRLARKAPKGNLFAGS